MKSRLKPRKSCYAGVSSSASASSSARAARALLRNTIMNGNVYKRDVGAGMWRAALNSYRRERVATANAALAAAKEDDFACDRVLEVRF